MAEKRFIDFLMGAPQLLASVQEEEVEKEEKNLPAAAGDDLPAEASLPNIVAMELEVRRG